MSDPMTIDDKTKALIEAVKALIYKYPYNREPTIDAALAAFDPEPEMVYVLAEKMPDAFINWAWEYCASETDKHGDVIPMDKNKLWQSLRELTRKPKVEGREFWLWKGKIYNDPITAADGAGWFAPMHVREVLP